MFQRGLYRNKTLTLVAQKYAIRLSSSASLQVHFGKSANDYSKHRHGLPWQFFKELQKRNVALTDNKILDIGTGTGDTARNLAKLGCLVTAIDPEFEMLEKAKVLDQQNQIRVKYEVATAENTGQTSNEFDAVTAVQSYHWFKSDIALKEITRVLKPNGQLVIASYDWKSHTSISLMSQSLVKKYNPQWEVLDFYKKPFNDLCNAQFRDIQVVNFFVKELYTHIDWIGRLSTSYGIAPSLSPEQVSEFKHELKAELQKQFPSEPLEIGHHCHIFFARRPRSASNALYAVPSDAPLKITQQPTA